MQITDISFKLPTDDLNPKLVALADVTLDNLLIIKGVKIITSSQGLFVAMPVKKSPKGMFRDIITITDSEFRRKFDEKILTTYEQIKPSLNQKPA